MEAHLFNWTRDPLETFWISRKTQQNITPNSIEDVKKTVSQTDLEDNYLELANEGLTSPMEFVATQWKLIGCSRELQQQITRHRIGIGFSIESMRVIPKENFAVNKDYRGFDHLNEEQQGYMDHWMQSIQNLYENGQKLGIPIQDLRAGLPLATTSTITMTAAWNSLIGMLKKRLCLKAQEEVMELGYLMRAEIAKKMPTVMLAGINAPCYGKRGFCVIGPENKRQLAEAKLTGEQNTDHICPLYIPFTEGKLKSKGNRGIVND
tara:strand:+ start:323 stop:1114 length:792 start_codon:yes stop_codon:yes gene_type:complete